MGIISYLFGYRTCKRCRKRGYKNKMEKITIFDERMKPRQVLYHSSCAEDYYKELSKRFRAFSDKNDSKEGLEKKV